MRIPKFSEKELEVVGETPPLFGMPGLPFFNYPCSMKEAVDHLPQRSLLADFRHKHEDDDPRRHPRQHRPGLRI